nr:septum formation initiator [Actinacidiphila yeochonensis]
MGGLGFGLLGGRQAADRSATAARTPFVVLVVALLGGGLITLLLLNSAVNSDSFKLDKLKDRTTGYTDEQQQLQQEVDGYSAPGQLSQRAQQLGMVPGGVPAFLGPDGTVHGSPTPATAPPSPPPSPAPTAADPTTPSGALAPPAGTVSGTTSGTASGNAPTTAATSEMSGTSGTSALPSASPTPSAPAATAPTSAR